jgi:hypothetical protein
VSVDVLRWEGLLQGEELAHLATEPSREARFAPLPDELDARVRAAIGVTLGAAVLAGAIAVALVQAGAARAFGRLVERD